jgi:hypothetical protein
MSDLILVETVDNVISNINEDNNTFKSDKTYNIDYDINERLRFLQDKYKDYEFRIINNHIRYRKKGTKIFRECCINFDCIKRPNFCIEGETKPTHCSSCSNLAEEENIIMIDIYAKNRKCIKCKKTIASFCIEGGTKATHCKDCSLETGEEMENIANKNKKCIKCNKTCATFCIEGEIKPTHCSSCGKLAEEEENIKMKSIDKRKCIVCNERIPSFCKIGETKATHCKDCSVLSGEVIIDIFNKNKNCIICKKTRATYCIEGGTKATHCKDCSLETGEKMEDIKHQKCKNIIDGNQCKTRITEKYDGYCFQCYFKINSDEIPTKNIKIKENAVIEFIKLIYTQESRVKFNIKNIIYDKTCGNTKKKPDIVIICENNVIVLEVDEFQHKKHSKEGQQYSKENEENKMGLIKDYYKSINKKTIYIRFNPDGYLSKDNKKIKSPWKEDETKKLMLIDETDWNNRLKILKEKVDFYLKKKEIKNNSTIYLFYDGYKL